MGVSQPHIHNVLKGVRALSPELSDQILQHLRISLLDLIERERIEAHLNFGAPPGDYVYVPLLRGSIGPGFPWPTETAENERLPFQRRRRWAQFLILSPPVWRQMPEWQMHFPRAMLRFWINQRAPERTSTLQLTML